MATNTAPTLQHYLDEASFPVPKEGLLEQARAAGLPADDLALLGRLPNQTYMTAVDVSLGIDELTAKANQPKQRKVPSSAGRTRATTRPKTASTEVSKPQPNVKSEATQATNRIAQRIGDVAKERIDAGKGVATMQLGRVAESLRRNEQEFRTAGDTMLADVADAAAAGLERTSEFLATRDVEAIAGSVQSTVRRQPVVTVGVVAAAGFVAARALKAGIGGPPAPEPTKNQNER